MKISKKDRSVFSDYLKPLQLLERTFRAAGIPVEFCLRDGMVTGKVICVSHPRFPAHKSICIEGDSICQAIKDVAAFVLDKI